METKQLIKNVLSTIGTDKAELWIGWGSSRIVQKQELIQIIKNAAEDFGELEIKSVSYDLGKIMVGNEDMTEWIMIASI